MSFVTLGYGILGVIVAEPGKILTGFGSGSGKKGLPQIFKKLYNGSVADPNNFVRIRIRLLGPDPDPF